MLQLRKQQGTVSTQQEAVPAQLSLLGRAGDLERERDFEREGDLPFLSLGLRSREREREGERELEGERRRSRRRSGERERERRSSLIFCLIAEKSPKSSSVFRARPPPRCLLSGSYAEPPRTGWGAAAPGRGVRHLKHSFFEANTLAPQPGQAQSPGRPSGAPPPPP